MIVRQLEPKIDGREIDGSHFEKWLPFCLRDESAMALYLKMFVRSYSIIVLNFKFVSQSARFGQNFTPTTPTMVQKLDQGEIYIVHHTIDVIVHPIPLLCSSGSKKQYAKRVSRMNT